MKDKKLIFGIALAFVFLASIGLSYAYFSSAIANNNTKAQVVTTGTLELTYTDSPEIVMQNIKPGSTITKTITVENTGTLDAKYNIIWQELNNEITEDEMVISLTCERKENNTVSGTCEGVTETPISQTNIKRNITIESNVKHEYTITITFKDTNAAQNYNQNKKFNGVIGIEEYQMTNFEKDSWETIAASVRSGNISKYSIGDTRTIDMGSFGTHTVRIANTSTPDECSTAGFSQTACGFVIEFEDIITTHNMNPIGEYNGTTYEYGWNKDGWPGSSLYTYVQNDIYNALPEELKNVIIDTTVVSSHGPEDTSNFTSIDKLYLLSPEEVYSDFSLFKDSYDHAVSLSKQLDYYKGKGVTTSNYSGAIKKFGTTASFWWSRTAILEDCDMFLGVSDIGELLQIFSYMTNGVSPAFRIG